MDFQVFLVCYSLARNSVITLKAKQTASNLSNQTTILKSLWGVSSSHFQVQGGVTIFSSVDLQDEVQVCIFSFRLLLVSNAQILNSLVFIQE